MVVGAAAADIRVPIFREGMAPVAAGLALECESAVISLTVPARLQVMCRAPIG